MIIYVEFTGTDESKLHFSFFNTVNERFKTFNGCQAWESTEDFIGDYNGSDSDRYLSLIPNEIPHKIESDVKYIKKISIEEKIKQVEREVEGMHSQTCGVSKPDYEFGASDVLDRLKLLLRIK